MTVHFAAARTAALSPVARALTRRAAVSPANDNGDTTGSDHLLHSALRHFARHGLAAATEARHLAEDAFFAGDRETYEHWLGVCRTLDRRMAEAIAKHQQFL